MTTPQNDRFTAAFTVPPLSRLSMFIFCWVISFLIGSLTVGLIGWSGLTTAKMRIAMVIQDLFVFIVPAIVTAVVITRRPADFLMVRRAPRIDAVCLVLLIIVASAPMMNAIIAWNESLTLPADLAGLSEWMRNAENSARESMQMLIGDSSVSSLVATLLIVAVMAGLSEEIFFRGGLQRLLVTYPVNRHLAIWITAFLFSAVHLQFFGFFPRLLLGALFGYLAVWSGSLWLPIIAHIANNAIAATILWHQQQIPSAPSLNDVGVAAGGTPDWGIVVASALFTAICIAYLYHRLHRLR